MGGGGCCRSRGPLHGLSLAGASGLVDLSWAALPLGRRDEVRQALDRIPGDSLWLDASRAVLEEAFERAAEIFAEIGSLPNEARARLRAGQKLLAERHAEHSQNQLGRALAFYRQVGATAYAREAEQLLAAAS